LETHIFDVRYIIAKVKPTEPCIILTLLSWSV